jgi:hypothetical protein
MVCPAPKSLLGLRPTYGYNMGGLEGNIIGEAGSCSLKYGALVDPANAVGLRVYWFSALRFAMVG